MKRKGEMKRQQPVKNNVLDFLSGLKSCSMKKDLLEGRRIHIAVVETGNDSNTYVAGALINMYSKCRSMVDARRVFDGIEEPNVVSWNALILGYAENGQGHAGLELFSRMKGGYKCAPNSRTYVAAIKSCASLAACEDEAGKRVCLKRGREIHSDIGHHMNYFVQSTLINMYAKCGSMIDARRVFDNMEEPNVVSYTALMLGYAENREGQAALELFSRMKISSGYAPDFVAYIAAIKACTALAADGDPTGKLQYLKLGKEIHSQIGHHMNHILQNTLLNMYSKCGSILDARRLFDSIDKPDVVSWTALILAYAENEEGQVALDVFSRMKTSRECPPDSVTYVAALKACGSIGALATGRRFHSEITDFDVQVVTCLVDFYSKCGSIVEARELFDSYPRRRNISTWTALITGYGSFGDTVSVFNLFDAMQDQGFRPDAVTFVCMLSCCNHAGLVEKAREYLEAMPVQFGVTPTVMHYNCMIDVYGRANQLDKAVALLQKMPCNPDAVTWMALLDVCCKWKNIEIGQLAFQSLVELDKNNAAAYVLMAEIYGSRGMWEDQEKVMETRRKFGGRKLLDQSYVMDGLGNMVKFVVGEEDPPEVNDKMKQFLTGIREHSYASSISYNETICDHSETRAVVYGILKTTPGEPIRAFKNTRMCGECHWSIKIFSKLSERIIVIRDEIRFHVMENGNCSCGE